MIAELFRYSFTQAKTRALRSMLLSAEDWYYLSRMRNLGDFLRYLGASGYEAVLSLLSDEKYDLRLISPLLYEALFADYGKLLRAVPRQSANLLKSLLLRYEAENLKSILRGIQQGTSPSEIKALLYRLNSLSGLPIASLLQAPQVTTAVALLKSTVFHPPLLQALPRYKTLRRLFPLEMAVDLTALEQILKASHLLSRIDRRGTDHLLGQWIDLTNVCWLVRFRHIYKLSAEESINYTLPGGGRLKLRELGNLARSPDLSSFLTTLPEPYRQVLGPVREWTQIYPLFERWFVTRLHNVFSKNPFQIGLPVSYLLLREIEIKSLESLISVIDIGESPEKFLKFLPMPFEGEAHVQV